MAKKRTRTTTSVSTLVTQINDLRMIAKVSGRKDLLKEFNLLAIEINFLAEKYVKIRKEIDPFVNLMLKGSVLEDPSVENAKIQEEEEKAELAALEELEKAAQEATE